MKKIHNRYTIISNQKVCDKFFRMSLDAPDLAKAGQPGQFVSIRTTDSLEPFFRRPFGIYSRQNGSVDMLIEIRGKGTSVLEQKKPGDTLDILGPLGRPFCFPSENIDHVVLIGGGIGVAPLFSLAQALEGSGKQMTLLYGARTQQYVFDLKIFEETGCQTVIATDDGSIGVKGRVSELFGKIPLDSDRAFIYTCGPTPMMKSVQEFAREHGLNGECSCEEVMACGIGACLGCVVRTTAGYKTACHDGPVFDLGEVIF